MGWFGGKKNNELILRDFPSFSITTLRPTVVLDDPAMFVQLTQVPQSLFEIGFIYDAALDAEMGWKQPLISLVNNMSKNNLKIGQIICLYQAFWIASLIHFGKTDKEFFKRTGITREYLFGFLNRDKPSFEAIGRYVDQFLIDFNPLSSFLDLIAQTLLLSEVAGSDVKRVINELVNPLEATFVQGAYLGYSLKMKKEVPAGNIDRQA